MPCWTIWRERRGPRRSDRPAGCCKQPRRLPGGKRPPIRQRGLPFRADQETRCACLLCDHGPTGAVRPSATGGWPPPWAGWVLAGGFGCPACPDPGAALGQGRWPLPDHRGPAEQSSVFPPAVHALGTFSAARPCPPPSATRPDWLSGTCRPHWHGVCATLSARLRPAKGAVAHRQGRSDPSPGSGKPARRFSMGSAIARRACNSDPALPLSGVAPAADSGDKAAVRRDGSDG